MSKTIEKKVLSKYFKMIEDGSKTFELRLADWEGREGDTLVLKEVDDEKHELTGRTLARKIGWIGKTKELCFWSDEEVDKYGYQMISLLDIDETKDK